MFSQKVKIMGVLNATPDSFSDGGNFNSTTTAVNHAHKMLTENADIIDIGGESSRPNANAVSLNDELKRVIPIIQEVKKINKNIQISVDTYKEEVMKKSLELGVNMINDIYALQKVKNTDFLASSDCKICLMHMQGNPQTMQNNPKYNNIIDEIKSFFEARIDFCVKSGIDENRIILDPGFGFGKTYDNNITILKNLQSFKNMGFKILAGLSKKSMFDTMLGGREPNGRIMASTIAAGIAIDNGADIIRTHNPLEISDMLKVKNTLN
jgi:dihydropteroate synthase